MSGDVYINKILKPIVKPWIDRGDNFILEEDGDLGHGNQHSTNLVGRYKQEIGLEILRNSSSSPDLALIENCWQPAKQETHKYPY